MTRLMEPAYPRLAEEASLVPGGRLWPRARVLAPVVCLLGGGMLARPRPDDRRHVRAWFADQPLVEPLDVVAPDLDVPGLMVGDEGDDLSPPIEQALRDP